MIKIKLNKEKNLDSALKKFKSKFDKLGLKKELLDRKEFVKPSITRREEIKNAIYREKFRNNLD